MKFRDILYGQIELPEWLEPFLTMPEFVRLRGVRLSNIDSIEFKDFSAPMRWEHSIGVAHLALTYSRINHLPLRDTIIITLSSLLHDIGTPPFAHTVENIFAGFDHEEEAVKLLTDGDIWESGIYEGESPQFHKLCKELNKNYGLDIEPTEIAENIVGNGKYGFLINGSIDLDNIDNLIRACLFLGKDIDKKVPYELVKWLSNYNSAPTGIYSSDNGSVRTWIEYRNFLYGNFFNSSEIELGRQAFLQHLIRRAFNEGLTKRSIIWNTDELLLITIESFNSNRKLYPNSLKSLVKSFRLLEKTFLYTTIPIESEQDLRIISNPLFANWLETYLSTEYFEPFVIINQKRYKDKTTLFPVLGEIQIYKLKNTPLKVNQLPKFVNEKLPKNLSGALVQIEVGKILKEKLKNWLRSKPWQRLDKKREDNLISNLEHEKDWSFKNASNNNIHTYPATFVNSIPRSLISSLELQGELLLDPFGGTGQTAEEAIKLGCDIVISDNNAIANLATKAKFKYLSSEQRQMIREISMSTLKCKILTFPQNAETLKKWFNPNTFKELVHIYNYVLSVENQTLKDYLMSCFSDILIPTSSRKGKGHSYFADNTPLYKGQNSIEYQNAFIAFETKAKKNLLLIEQFYSLLERKNRDPQDELKRVTILKCDVRLLTPQIANIEPKSVAGIVTSPPYLCMIDYTLGQRLSYEWLFPELLEVDFIKEIGSRRKRTNPSKALLEYLDDFKNFANMSKAFLRKNGYLSLVIGEPTANAFKDKYIFENIDLIMQNAGFRLIWEKMRPISKHRNHGLRSLNEEKIVLYVLE